MERLGQFSLPFLAACIIGLIVWSVLDERRTSREAARREKEEAAAARDRPRRR
ncbi:MAG: heme exporter protein CcmD [Phenylobacterium sp.]